MTTTPIDEKVRNRSSLVEKESAPLTEREKLEAELGITLPSTCEVFCDDGACVVLRTTIRERDELRAALTDSRSRAERVEQQFTQEDVTALLTNAAEWDDRSDIFAHRSAELRAIAAKISALLTPSTP